MQLNLKTPQHYLVTFVFSNPCDIIVYLRTTLVKNTHKRSKKIPKKCEQSNKRGLLPENSSLLLKCAAVQRMETRNVNDDEEAPKGSQSWLRDLWSQKNTTTQTPLARTMSGSRTTLPVFFDRTTSVGSTAFWLKEPHALAALNSEGSEQETKEAELARAAQAALEVAQVRRPRRETAPMRKNMSCLVVCA